MAVTLLENPGSHDLLSYEELHLELVRETSERRCALLTSPIMMGIGEVDYGTGGERLDG
jgi:hypothetical protein